MKGINHESDDLPQIIIILLLFASISLTTDAILPIGSFC